MTVQLVSIPHITVIVSHADGAHPEVQRGLHFKGVPLSLGHTRAHSSFPWVFGNMTFDDVPLQGW